LEFFFGRISSILVRSVSNSGLLKLQLNATFVLDILPYIDKVLTPWPVLFFMNCWRDVLHQE